MILYIYTRDGCCICENLKNNLHRLDINNTYPTLEIFEIDIDRYDLYKNHYKKYDHQVPVLALKPTDSKEIFELPSISPRLKDLQLNNWLEKNINSILLKVNN